MSSSKHGLKSAILLFGDFHQCDLCIEKEKDAPPGLDGLRQSWSSSSLPLVAPTHHHQELLLVLGRPGSGTSTFLSALGDRLANNLEVEVRMAYVDLWQPTAQQGEVLYNGVRGIGQYRKEIKFVEADDKHVPALTVEQTLRIAAEMSTPLNMPLREPLIQFASVAVLLFVQLTSTPDPD
jgi:hypothetical protein